MQTVPARRKQASSDESTPDASDSSTETSAPDEESSSGRGPTLERSIGWLLVTLGFLIGSRAISDNSFFTHLATGGVILDERSVPTGDVFSYTAAGEPWTVQSWFASVWYRSIYEVAGLGALRIANGLVAAALVATLWRLTERARTLLPRVFLLGAALTVGTLMWTPRPLMFGLLCFALAIELIERPQRPLWLLVPIMWVWVNTHGSFPLMFVFLGAVGVGQLIDDRRIHRRDLHAGFWLIGGTLLGAVNPTGPKLLTFPFELLAKREALENVVEWMPPNWDRPSEWAFALLAVAVLVGARFGVAWRHVLPAVGFFVTGFLAVRNLNPAAVVLLACAAPGLSNLPGALDGQVRGLAARGIAATSAVLFALVGVFALMTPGIDYAKFPVLEVDWLEERGLVARPDQRLVHRDTTGNYLELRFSTEARVFMDDRYDMYPIELIDDHAELYFGGDFAAILDRYDATAVLWESEGDFAEWLRTSDDWQVTVDNDDWIIAIPSGAGG